MYPLFAGRVPGHFRVAVFADDMGQNRIARVFRPRPAPIHAVHHALRRTRRPWIPATYPPAAVYVATIGFSFSVAKPVVLFQSTTAEPDQIGPYWSGIIALPICCQCVISLLTAWPHDRLPRLQAERVVLKEQVVLALIIHHAVRVVEPAFLRRKMELRTVRFVVYSSSVLMSSACFVIALNDLVYVDVAPSARRAVYDFQPNR